MNGMIAERIQRTKKITTLTKIAAEHIIMNKEMVEQQEESIDVPKTMNLPPVTVITVVAEPEAMNCHIAKNIIKLPTTQRPRTYLAPKY